MNATFSSVLCLSLLAASALAQPSGLSRPWSEDIIYFALLDRFHDGDPANNRPSGSDPSLYDPAQSDVDLYHGGDFRGLELALESGYFNRLGITAIWITPPVRNVWYSQFDSNDAPKTGYHGYWTQDFLDIDPHLVSRRSLDGSRTYPDNREGRMQHYKDLVALAHSKGIKIIQDIVCNHAGPVFYYDANQNERFDWQNKSEWIQPFKEDGYYTNARWAEKPQWNLYPTQPVETLSVLGQEVPIRGSFGDFASYGRKGFSPGSLSASNGEEVTADFLSLRDFWTAPGSPHFDALVDDFVEIYAFYIETIGVDGLRIDTVKHVHHAFWDAFTERLRARLGPERSERLILFGEVYDGDPVSLGKYTYRSEWPEDTRPSIDSLLNFQFCYAVRSYLRTGDDSVGTAQGIATALAALEPKVPTGRDRPYYNPTPGPDGLNAAQKTINFFENHDDINRFRVRGVSAQRNRLANALTLTMPGIPCLYYGTEVALLDDAASVDEGAESGRMTFIPRDRADRMHVIASRKSFQQIAALSRLRRELPALTSDATKVLWVDSEADASDDGIFAFVRGSGKDAVIVVVNAAPNSAQTAIPGREMTLVDAQGAPLLQRGDQLEPISLGLDGERSDADRPIELSWHESLPSAVIEAAPESIQLFRIAR